MRYFMAICLLLFSLNAYAHKLTMLAYYESGVLTVTSYFSDGTYCKDCDLIISAEDGTELYTGKLNAEAEAVLEQGFPLPFNVVVDAGMGHRAEETVTRDEAEEEEEVETDTAESVQTGAVDMKELKQFIRKELAAQKAEIISAVELNKSTLDRMIAGVGYIFGIFGLVVLVRRR